MKNYKQKQLSLKLRVFAVCFLLLLSSVSLWAQQQVSGTITDEAGVTLPGVSVRIINTTNGVISDTDGKYVIRAKSGDVLEFSYMGMATQNVTLKDQVVINIRMKEESHVLTETVIIGYGSAKKRDLTGSIATVSGTDITNKPMTNPTALMQGKVAGVQVTNSGKPGADPPRRLLRAH